MRFLADENFPRPTVESLRKEGHDVVWVRTDCPGLSDRRLIERAEADNRLILTLDKDFWQLALQRPDGLPNSGVILFRVHPAIPEKLQRTALR
jgi:predicted nuclease of predicted toxin-antitoxin system